MKNVENTVKRFNERWLADGIGDSYKFWYNKVDARLETGRPFSTPGIVLIKSPTGTGKTTFILEKLALYAAENNRNILYFGNRTALNEQFKIAAKSRFNEIKSKKQDIVEFELNNFESILSVLSYQSLDKLNEYYLNPYYVIFDEAHYFTEDSLFNKKTHSNFVKVLRKFPNSALIFMTATPVDFEEIFNILVPKSINTHLFPDTYDIISTKNILKYENTYFPPNYKAIAYSNKEEILYAMNNTPENEKWLVFVNSVRDGKEFLEKINVFTNKKVKLLTADGKKGVVWETLISENCFKSDVLIVTRVIDSGVNIHDADVAHIVLPFCAEADFSQMLGRRRINGTETVKIYVEDITIQSVNSKFNQLRGNLNIIEAIEKANQMVGNKRKAETEKLKTALFNAKRKSFTNYISLRDGNLIYNKFAYYKLGMLERFYIDLKNSYKANPDFYLSHIKRWLKTKKSINHVFAQDCNDFIEFLERFKNIPIPESEAEFFYNAFQYYYKRYCTEKFKDDSEALDNALNIRKGKTQRKSTMNKSLNAVELPYEIGKHNNCWIIM